MERGVLAVVSGFSGSGKGTLMKRLVELYDNYALSVSATTRSPREGEREGVEYFFRTEEEFAAMIAQDAFLEHARYVEHAYGTPAAYVEEQLELGRDVLLEIETQGALQVKGKCPEAVLLFITPPTVAELERRLVGRQTESGEDLQNRLRRASEEAEVMEQYDYIIINDDIDEAVKRIHGILMGQRCRASACDSFIRNIRKELKEREE